MFKKFNFLIAFTNEERLFIFLEYLKMTIFWTRYSKTDHCDYGAARVSGLVSGQVTWHSSEKNVAGKPSFRNVNETDD